MSVPPAPISLAAIQARLTAGHAIVEFASLPDVTLAWVIAHDRITPVELPVSSREIAEAVRTLNGRDPVDARGVLSALYDRLFAPLGPALSAQQLTIVPDKVLNAVPFPALLNRTARRYLIEQHVLTMVPSATVWLACDRRPSANTARPDGDLLFAAGAPSNGAGALPNLQRERNAIVALYPGARMANGSKTTLLEQIGEHEVVHFAGHGIRDSSHPEFSSLVFSQARLYAHEIAARSFARTRVVVLSACGTRDPSWSDQALFSVPEAFLAANVREVVAALDAVDDGAAADIVISFHRHLRHGETVAAALRSAQLEAIGRTAPVREWASWVVIGA